MGLKKIKMSDSFPYALFGDLGKLYLLLNSNLRSTNDALYSIRSEREALV